MELAEALGVVLDLAEARAEQYTNPAAKAENDQAIEIVRKHLEALVER